MEMRAMGVVRFNLGKIGHRWVDFIRVKPDHESPHGIEAMGVVRFNLGKIGHRWVGFIMISACEPEGWKNRQ